ncbi:hypothetical protein D3C75_1160750 [compost metagenome]
MHGHHRVEHLALHPKPLIPRSIRFGVGQPDRGDNLLDHGRGVLGIQGILRGLRVHDQDLATGTPAFEDFLDRFGGAFK